MKHDEAHELKQNAVVRMLATAIAQVAAHNGHSGMKSLVADVDAMLAKDEAEPEAVASAEEPKASLVKSLRGG